MQWHVSYLYSNGLSPAPVTSGRTNTFPRTLGHFISSGYGAKGSFPEISDWRIACAHFPAPFQDKARGFPDAPSEE